MSDVKGLTSEAMIPELSYRHMEKARGMTGAVAGAAHRHVEKAPYKPRKQPQKVTEALLLDNAVCVAPINQLSMLHDYASPTEKLIADPNQDVVYGLGYLSLEKEPVVLQVPDFGDRFWTLPLYDARTDQFSQLGLQYGTKPGFYMVVGPNWKGDTPPGIAGVVRSST